ncbi:MAG: c-type cytochrome [Acidobacteria bacterium]|nr:c-type cytochrome [Acidobacteriota bacterium]
MRRLAVLIPLLPLLAPAQNVKVNGGALKLFRPLPVVVSSDANPITEAKAGLGRKLYFETRLSRNRDVSCNTCHPLDRYGADGAAVSTGHQGQKGTRNSPTVYNAAGHLAQFWDGRAATIEEQAKGPVLNPVEMAMRSPADVAAALKAVPEYPALFRHAFPGEADPVTFDNVARAIGAFERRLITPGRWDRFLKGDQTALTGAEKAGFNKFVESGCAACHYGPYVGGNAFQKVGMVHPWPNTADPGRQQVTGKESDRMLFKVPSLRNVTRTAPYFHDGSGKTLAEAIRQMASHQVGKNLADGEIRSIAVWLETLTGELPAGPIAPSGP